MALRRKLILGLIQKMSAVLVAPVTLALLASFFSPQMQGFYYTFLGLVGFEVLLHLGLGVVVFHLSTHEWARLNLVDGRLEGDGEALSRLGSLFRKAAVWCTGAGIILLLVIGGVGLWFMDEGSSSSFAWRLPWVLFCLLAGLNLIMIPFWTLLDGCDQMENTFLFRTIQVVGSNLVLWIGIVLGLGLWAVVLSSAVAVITGFILVLIRYGSFFRQLLKTTKGRFSWSTEVWPMHSRVALNSASGFLLVGLFVPLLFRYGGAVEAGQFGLTWAFFAMALSVGLVMINIRAPDWGERVVEGQHVGLRHEMSGLGRRVTVIFVVLMGLQVGFIAAVPFLVPAWEIRLVPVLVALVMALGTLGQLLVFLVTSYFRAYRQEAFVSQRALVGILTVLSVLVCIPLWGLMAAASVYALSHGALLLLIFRQTPELTAGQE